jgi:hypothetical protein
MSTDIKVQVMRTSAPYFITLFILLVTLSSCSTQNWYTGAQSAQEAQCMKEPAATYDECMKQTNQSYDEYSKKREKLIKENQSK